MRKLTIMIAAVLGLSSAASAASIDAISFTAARYRNDDPAAHVLGFNFTTGNVPVTVSALGYINDGFNGTHTIVLYDVVTRVAVAGASATVTTVGGGSSSTSFTYAALPSLVQLVANRQYQIVSENFDNEYYFTNATGVTVASGVTFDVAVYQDFRTLPATPGFATNPVASNGVADFGPNFQLLIADVPEPGSLLLMAAGLALGAAAAGRTSKR